jgi:hypothetical protein
MPTGAVYGHFVIVGMNTGFHEKLHSLASGLHGFSGTSKEHYCRVARSRIEQLL